ncbi:methyltransferase domain-containing protein, partial [Brachyspira hampsonii]|uniref:methyltransferase domain-containing protein n=1 Tax=Brachyspira hampsonii TaxID=1287055 RepID=UPI0002AE0279
HILEHIAEPDIFINNILELVSDNGYIYIEIPTLESIAHHFNYYLFDFQSAHVYYYTEFNFLKLLKN